MPIRNYGGFMRMTGFCKTMIPKELKENLNKFKDDASGLYKYGMDYVSKMCQQLLSAKNENNKYIIPGIHIYTMNTQKVTVELISRLKIGYDWNKNLEGIINSELQRCIKEEEEKKKEKQRKEELKKSIVSPSPVDKGDFKEITSF